MNSVFSIHSRDNAAVALRQLNAGEIISINETEIVVKDAIQTGHKIALRDIEKGEAVVKYGFPIGIAKEFIHAGCHIHSHNLKSRLGELLEYQYSPEYEELLPLPAANFMGYRRNNGSVGIRNEIWIIPTVGCVNSIAKIIEDETQKFISSELDGIYSYSHAYGCSQLGDDQLYTQRLLCGLINHPNAGGVLVLGLGCENNNIDELKKILGEYDAQRVKFLNCQDFSDEIQMGVSLVKELCSYAAEFKREPCKTDELIVGLKCGGSDGFSGITANPLVGTFSDLLVAQGGTTILTEVPEMFGAEQLLMNRCRTKEAFDKTVLLINDFKNYFLRYGQHIDENPSPGNKAGGITTLEDKSLGCVQKAGSAPVEDVLKYGQQAMRKGLNLLQGPGNDLVASCALAASGAQLILFTTGRGTPFGCPVPTIKISSNSELALRKPHWIDYDAGQLLSGKSEISSDFFDYVISVASGQKYAKSEAFDKRELAIFKDGVIL